MTYIKNKIATLRDRVNRIYGIRQIKKHKFWFIDVPRTSSSSIKIELSREFGVVYGKNKVFEKDHRTGFIFKPHITAREMRDILGKKTWNKLYTFTFVRNPWDRVLSIYHYLQYENMIQAELSFKDYIVKLNYEIQHKNWTYNYAPFYLGASDFVTDEKGKIIVSKIGKFENREEDINMIAKKIQSKNLGKLFLQKASPSNEHYSTYYDEESIEIVRNIYQDDISLFNYKFESKP